MLNINLTMIIIFYIFMLISASFSFNSDECEKNNVLDGNCYTIDTSTGKLSYKEAKLQCQKNKGNLAFISDQKTLDFISEIFYEFGNWTDSVWIEFCTQRHDGSWTTTKSRINRYHYSHISCTRLDQKSLKAAQTSCGHLYYPLCQYRTLNCSINEIALPFTNFAVCSTNETIPFNASVRIDCTNGHILKGPQRLRCTSNGTWDHIPSCIAKCLPPLVNDGILIHNFKPEYDIGDRVLLLCNSGYFPGGKYLKSHQIATCESNGLWANLNVICIPEDRLNCPSDICQTIQLHIRSGHNVTLNCTGNEAYGVDLWPHFHWLKDHSKLQNDGRIVLTSDGVLQITKFESRDRGMYSCVRGSGETHIERVVVYDIRIKYTCEIDPDRNLPTIIVPEDASVYLKSKGTSGIDVAWFKDGLRIWGDERKIVLPNGDLLVRGARTPSDDGFYTFELETETYIDLCIDRSVKLTIIPRASSICGLAEPAYPHPWLTSLWWNHETLPFCYGTLINEQWVLTSAFCLSRFHRLKEHFVSVGFESDKTVKVKVDIFAIHPHYSKRLNVNDIGLVKLIEPVIFNHFIRPICIPKDVFERVAHTCVKVGRVVGNVSGLGSLDAVNSRTIRRESMVVVDKGTCDKYVMFQLPDTMFCAESSDKRGAVFAADVGAPFEVVREGRTYLYGVYSWGQRLPQVGFYDYFTKIEPYYQWIKKQLV